MNKEECLIKLDYLGKLEFNWDSYNALPIPTIVINKAIELLELFNYNNINHIAAYFEAIQL